MNITFIIKLKSIIVNAYLKKLFHLSMNWKRCLKRQDLRICIIRYSLALMENGLQED